VLDLAREADPRLEARLRRVASFGPSPGPPWVIGRTVPSGVRAAVRRALLAMHEGAAGREVLSAGQASRFAPVTDADYDPIRRMAQESAHVELGAR
jgi:ABC-type phosphate/phosphonate transport system substrate-binding protein